MLAILSFFGGSSAGERSGGSQATRPKISQKLKPKIFERVLKREVMSYADLSDVSPQDKQYSFYASMLVRRGIRLTQKNLMRFDQYDEMSPYIDHARFDPKTQILDIAGGVFGLKMRSWVQFKEVLLGWLDYRVIKGNFNGMTGSVWIDQQGERSCIVYFFGQLNGKKWPPAFVLERGAEIVLSYTGGKMRNFIESPPPEPRLSSRSSLTEQNSSKGSQDKHRDSRLQRKGTKDGQRLPQPQSHY